MEFAVAVVGLEGAGWKVSYIVLLCPARGTSWKQRMRGAQIYLHVHALTNMRTQMQTHNKAHAGIRTRSSRMKVYPLSCTHTRPRKHMRPRKRTHTYTHTHGFHSSRITQRTQIASMQTCTSSGVGWPAQVCHTDATPLTQQPSCSRRIHYPWGRHACHSLGSSGIFRSCWPCRPSCLRATATVREQA